MSGLIESGMSARSVNRKVASLSTFFKLMARKGIVKSGRLNSISKPKQAKTLPVFFDEDKLNRYLSENDGKKFSGGYEESRDAAIVELLYATGMRVGELVNLKVDDADFSGKKIKVTGKRNKQRFIPMIPTSEKALKKYLVEREKFVSVTENKFLFLTSKGNKIYEKAVYLIVRNRMTAAGFSGKRSPHVMRHSFATHILNNGAELNGVKEILGHAGLAATQVYTHNTFEKLKKDHARAHPRAQTINRQKDI